MSFDFSKITCSKEIGGGTGYQDYCAGRGIEDIIKIGFNEIVEALDLWEPEEQFFLYLEWDALRTALKQYLGRDEGVDAERYRIASIVHDADEIEISQVIGPIKDMPKIVSCIKRAAAPSDQSE